MPNFQPNVPTGIVPLDQDYLNLQGNNQTLDTAFGINHTPFSITPNQGKHTYAELLNQSGVPPGAASGEGTLYTKAISSHSQLFYTDDATGSQYQMTTTNSAVFSTFGTFTAYDGSKTYQFGGWTFLPGGLIMCYGQSVEQTTGGITAVTFPSGLFQTAIYSIQVTRHQTTNGVGAGTSSATTSGFNYGANNSSKNSFDWIAIGK